MVAARLESRRCNIYPKNTTYTTCSRSPFAALVSYLKQCCGQISRGRSCREGKVSFCSSNCKFFSINAADKAQEGGHSENGKISVTFVDKDGEEKLIKVPIGMSMLEAAHENGIDLEGACEGQLACTACHVIVRSRLACQVIARPELDGMRLAVPAATRNFAVNGYKPKPR